MQAYKRILKQFMPPILTAALARRKNRSRATLLDKDLHQPLFSPWAGLGDFKNLFARVAPLALVSADRCWVLYSLARQSCHLPGHFYEAGVYRGGTALLLKLVLEGSTGPGKTLRLFDTFTGMPKTDSKRDYHRQGDFADTSLEAVRRNVGEATFISYHVGVVPGTFAGLDDDRISFAHIDVDIYRSVVDCCAFIYPRLSLGGFIVCDDYGFPGCPGARAAVDEFFADKLEVPLVLPTGQAVVFRGPHGR